MIYVEEKNFDRQLELLEKISISEDAEIVFWLYPESKLDDLFGLSLQRSDYISAEPVTSYEDGVFSNCTKRLPFDERLLDLIECNRRVISDNCDSLCLYLKDSVEWSACTIGHEGMGLVRNVDLMDEIISSGFNASKNPPDWW